MLPQAPGSSFLRLGPKFSGISCPPPSRDSSLYYIKVSRSGRLRHESFDGLDQLPKRIFGITKQHAGVGPRIERVVNPGKARIFTAF